MMDAQEFFERFAEDLELIRNGPEERRYLWMEYQVVELLGHLQTMERRLATAEQQLDRYQTQLTKDMLQRWARQKKTMSRLLPKKEKADDDERDPAVGLPGDPAGHGLGRPRGAEHDPQDP